MPKATESIINFLSAKRDKEGDHKADLLDRFLRYGCAMEVQVNVAAGKGEPVDGKRSTYSDGTDTWFNFRIPKGAYDEPFFRDFPLQFPLDLHCDGIGSTGWDWKSLRSRWVGFDFDSITGHAEGVGVSGEDLDRVREAAKALPYVEVRRSTGGAGLHLYVVFEDTPEFDTLNHSEHAALARCILGVMSKDAGFDFQAQIDACGGNMWLWHRKSAGTEGLALMKVGEPFPAKSLPDNWRDNLPVVRGRRAKIQLAGVSSSEEDIFDQLATAHRQVPLDASHKDVMDAIAKAGITCVWINDHHLLQTHTVGFKRVMEECKITGVFETNSRGGDLASPNCFAFPLDNGAWRIFRFGQGITEAGTWNQDGSGWTTCTYNTRPNLDTAAKALGGRKLDKGGYEFDTVEQAAEVAKALKPGFEITIDESLKGRPAVVRPSKAGNLAIEVRKKTAEEIKKTGDEVRPSGDWNSTDKKNAWTQVFDVAAQPEKLEDAEYDNLIRCLETGDGQSAGWAAKKADGDWTRKPASEIKMILQDLGHAKPEAEMIMGRYARGPWKLVNRPFEPEYPGGRRWNDNAPQYRYKPAPRLDAKDTGDQGEDSQHPHWDAVLNHVGGDLTKYLRELEWACVAGIRTGADYLRCIFASILREPFEPTPYLCLFGPQNSGKSILHESFSLLVTRGVVKADRALTSQSDFNGELAGAILCVVEEKDIAKTPGAYAKIKDAVTATQLSIRKMRTDSFMVDNSTHWIQCANHPDACPVFDQNDTRITMIFVPELDKGKEIPKTQLLTKLKEEAPQFMRTLMDLSLPPASGRLRVPIVGTAHKQRAESQSRSMLDQFVMENLFEAAGHLVPYADFYTRFIEWLPAEEKNGWSKQRVSKGLPMKFSSGTGNENKTYIINASWQKVEVTDSQPYIIVNGRIKKPK